ncbi:MAG: hypothetical protein GX753_05560 [Erysipelothrix sp.]|nr:hypothetical protein [Erysipelothrix sp.]
MAKLEKQFKGDFNHFVNHLDQAVLKGSISASIEDKSDYTIDDVNVAVRVYERYSYFGGNRVSLSVTIVSKEDTIFLSAITAGGSQAVFVKINRFGEDSFLGKFDEELKNYLSRYAQ